jgi:hypothetical protein
MQWYIDAWAVWDGVAFISQRDEAASDVRQTVFVSAPEFSPVPVARISTAWAAARGHFQERLFGPDDTEVSFATLALAIETVRRGFRKGGGDAPGGFLAPITLPGNEGGDEQSGPPPFGADKVFGDNWKKVIHNVEEIETHESRVALMQVFYDAFQSHDVRDVLLKYASDIYASLLRSMFAMNQTHDWLEIKLFDLCSAWRPVFLLAGWSNPTRRDTFQADFQERMKKEPMYLMKLQSGLQDGVDWQSEARTLRDSLMMGMLFRIPLASNWPNDQARSLGDRLCLACADRQRLLFEIQNVRTFAPVILTALTVAVAKLGLPRLMFDKGQSLQNHRIDAIYAVASEWLGAALPGRELTHHPAEDVLASLTRVQEPAYA